MSRIALLSALLIAIPAIAEDKAGPKDNTAPEGFVALFNGKDLSGWKGHIDMNERKKSAADQEKLQAARNALMLETWTIKDYGDVEILVVRKIEKGGDSGLYLRGNPQVQIWDSENLAPSLKADANTGSGGLWNNPIPAGKNQFTSGKVPLKKADKPVGEWNTFKIVMKGDNVTIHLNDVLVVDNAPLNNYWEKGKPLPATGPFELQYHGDRLWFKNIYIKELK